ncbi:MAG TPA: zf-HC2 domain-containing protein [Gemmatimonadaceae bacterium]|nr:zf-HC2 domain-containing protein [Gemmatimonadaceae bacterium]
MTCDQFLLQLDAYHAGTLDDTRSTALELHASGCSSCESRLEALAAGTLPVFAPALPASLRSDVLHAIMARRAASRSHLWMRGAITLAAAAAIAVILVRPATREARLVVADSATATATQGDGAASSADDLARSEFRALDDAARELQAALERTPGDAELTVFLRSVDDQRAALRRQVRDAGS